MVNKDIKIGFIAATQTDYVARERLAGAKEAVQNDPSIQLEVFTGDYSRKSGYYGAKELLEKGVTAILSAIIICRSVLSNVSIKKVSESGRILRLVIMIIWIKRFEHPSENHDYTTNR